MIGRFVLAMFSLGMALIAFAVGSQNFLPLRFEGKEQPLVLAQHIHPECDASLSEYRSFAIVLYAHNAASWCEESLRSIFEQDYDHYRVLFVDDGSIDRTLEKAQQFILDNKQDHRFIAMRNESKLGKIASLYRSFDNCLDREIVIPLEATDRFAHEQVLAKLNLAFQNPDVWLAFGETVNYPAYEIQPAPSLDRSNLEKRGIKVLAENEYPAHAFYAGLFKPILLKDLGLKGINLQTKYSYLIPLLEQSEGRCKSVHEPLLIVNKARPVRVDSAVRELVSRSVY